MTLVDYYIDYARQSKYGMILFPPPNRHCMYFNFNQWLCDSQSQAVGTSQIEISVV